MEKNLIILDNKNEKLKDELTHFGILGMKWGKRKSKDEAKEPKLIRQEQRKQMSAIAKRSMTASRQSDIARAKRNEKPLPVRVAKQVMASTIQTVIGDALTGRTGKYANMSKKDWLKKAATIMGVATANEAIDTALAKSMAKNYTKEGKLKKGVKDSAITKQDAIQGGITTAVAVAPALYYMAGLKAMNVSKNRAKNEELAKRALPTKAGPDQQEPIWTSFVNDIIK